MAASSAARGASARTGPTPAAPRRVLVAGGAAVLEQRLATRGFGEVGVLVAQPHTPGKSGPRSRAPRLLQRLADVLSAQLQMRL